LQIAIAGQPAGLHEATVAVLITRISALKAGGCLTVELPSRCLPVLAISPA
jgi:hypothetical protein